MQEHALAFERPVVSELDHSLGRNCVSNSEEAAHVAWASLSLPHLHGGIRSGETWGCVCICLFASHGIGHVVDISNIQGVRIYHAVTLAHQWL